MANPNTPILGFLKQRGLGGWGWHGYFEMVSWLKDCPEVRLVAVSDSDNLAIFYYGDSYFELHQRGSRDPQVTHWGRDLKKRRRYVRGLDAFRQHVHLIHYEGLSTRETLVRVVSASTAEKRRVSGYQC